MPPKRAAPKQAAVLTEEKISSDFPAKAVLFTGGAGFIGSNVLCYLVNKYPQTKFVCLDKVTACANLKNFEEISERSNFEFVKGDICSADLVNHIMSAYSIDTVLHFAAETHVDNSFGNSLIFTKTNVLGTHTLLESAKMFKDQLRMFVHVSTDEVYGEASANDIAAGEQSVLAPTNPYAASKAAAEYMVQSYRKSFNLPTIITRGNNVYGPKQFPEKLIPKFIHLLKAGKPCPLHGTGENRRSFLHVMDVAKAFDCIINKGVIGQIYNIGSVTEITNKAVTQELVKLFGLRDRESDFIRYTSDRCFNDLRYNIDNSTLAALGWTQEIPFDKGLAMTKDWYLERPEYWGDVSSVLVAHPTYGQSITSSTQYESTVPTTTVLPLVNACDSNQAIKRQKK